MRQLLGMEEKIVKVSTSEPFYDHHLHEFKNWLRDKTRIDFSQSVDISDVWHFEKRRFIGEGLFIDKSVHFEVKARWKAPWVIGTLIVFTSSIQ